MSAAEAQWARPEPEEEGRRGPGREAGLSWGWLVHVPRCVRAALPLLAAPEPLFLPPRTSWRWTSVPVMQANIGEPSSSTGDANSQNQKEARPLNPPPFPIALSWGH